MKTIVYPGTFDPLTLGHEALVNRAARIFENVIVVVARGLHKKPLFDLDERVQMVERAVEALPNVTVEPLEGLLAEFLASRDIKVVLRGIRTVADFDFEIQLADINRRLGHEVETVFLAPTNEYIYVYSKVVREVAMLGGDVLPYVNPSVAELLKEKYKRG